MKKVILAMCLLGLTVACNKKDDDNKEAAPAPSPAQAGGQSTDDKTATTKRISINQKVKLVHLGQGVADDQTFKEKCLKGDASSETFEQANITYKMRKEGETVVAEMVVLTGATSLQNPVANSNAKSTDEKEFARKCGSAVVMKLYNGIRVSQRYQVSKEQAEKFQPLEMAGSAESRSQDFVEAVEKALENPKGESAKALEIRVEGIDAGAQIKGMKLADAMDEVKKMAGGKMSKDKEVTKEKLNGKPLEAEVAEYSAELKASAISPKAEDKNGDDSGKGEGKGDDDQPEKGGEPVDQSQEDFLY